MEAGRGLGHTAINGKLGGAWAMLEAGRGLGRTASNGKLGGAWTILEVMEAGRNITYNKGYFL